MLVPPLLAALCLIPAGDSLTAGELLLTAVPDDSATELRVYDLRWLVALQPSFEDWDAQPRLVPLMHVLPREDVASDQWPSGSDAVHQLMDVFMGGGWEDDWSIEYVTPGEVHLDAPREAHERFARLAGVFESAASDTSGVIVQRYIGPASLPSGIVGRDALAAALRGAGVTPSTHAMGLAARRGAKLGDTTSHTVVLAVEVEIAQSAAVHHAYTQEVLSGLELELTAEPTRSGVRLTYAMRATSATTSGDVDGATCSIELFSAERGRAVDSSSAWRESFALRGGGAIGTASIGVDECLVLCLATEDGQAEYCAIQLDPKKRTKASVQSVELGEGYVAEIVPAGCVRPVRMQVEGWLLNRPSTLSRGGEEAARSGEDSILGSSISRTESERLERLMSQLDTCSVLEVGGSTIMIVDEQGRGLMDRLLDIEMQMARPRLRVGVAAQGGTLETGVSGTFVADGGSQACVALGGERLEAQYAEVEVAQNASATVPIVRTRFDGLALATTFHPMADGRLAYRVTGQLSIPVDRVPGRANLVGGAGLVATETDHLFIDEQGVAAAAGPGVWRIVFGDSTGGGANVALDVRTER